MFGQTASDMREGTNVVLARMRDTCETLPAIREASQSTRPGPHFPLTVKTSDPVKSDDHGKYIYLTRVHLKKAPCVT